MNLFSSFGIRISAAAFACATIVSPAMAHEPMAWNGSEIHILLDKKSTGGNMGMFTVKTPGPGGPARHVHDKAGEGFYMLKGDAEFLSDGKLVVVKEGEAAFVPRGIEHTFRVINEEGGKILVVVSPGGFEGFFEATKHLTIPKDLPEIGKISETFGQTFTGPPLEAK